MRMKTLHVLSLLFLCATPLRAGEIKVGTRWPELMTTGGQRFWDVKFTFVSPREVRFMHTGGVGSMPLSQVVLPEDMTVTASASAIQPGPLGTMMTAEERKASGIDKLSNEEQVALARWMQQTASTVLKDALEKQWAQPSSFRLSATAPLPEMPSVPTTGADAAAPAGPSMMAAASQTVSGAETPAAVASPQAAPSLQARVNGVLQAAAFPAPSPALLPPPRPVLAPTAVPKVAED